MIETEMESGFDLQPKLSEYIRNSPVLFIFSPYIKLETWKALIDERENVKSVFVRWKTNDLILELSGLEIYPYLKGEFNIPIKKGFNSQ